jgi:hypothetical protein
MAGTYKGIGVRGASFTTHVGTTVDDATAARLRAEVVRTGKGASSILRAALLNYLEESTVDAEPSPEPESSLPQ